MSQFPLPSTPVPGTPTLRVPSPARTPSPLPLFTRGTGPYTYTGQITRKYAARFREIDKTKDKIKQVEDAWETEAKEKGVTIDELMKSSTEDEYNWEEHEIPRTDRNVQETVIIQEPIPNEEEEKRVSRNVDKRFSAISMDDFVDALTSPVERPRDWGDEAFKVYNIKERDSSI
jgi:hypothetical protein